MNFSSIEIKEILKAWFAISIAFGILITGNLFSSEFLINFLISILTVGIGFLLHELAHKFVAQRYNYYAEFRADNKMLLVSIVSAFLGFLFAAPGGVMINGGTNKRNFSLIASAGPAMNLVLAFVFLLISSSSFGFVNIIGTFGFNINSWLALFNLIPIFPFDGKKIIDGSKQIYFGLLIISMLLMIIQFI